MDWLTKNLSNADLLVAVGIISIGLFMAYLIIKTKDEERDE